MILYTIKYTDDPYCQDETIAIFSTKEKAEDYLNHMKTTNTDVNHMYIDEAEMDSEDYKNFKYTYNVYFREEDKENPSITSANYILDINDSNIDIRQWSAYKCKNPNTENVIITLNAKNIEEATSKSIKHYKQWLENFKTLEK